MAEIINQNRKARFRIVILDLKANGGRKSATISLANSKKEASIESLRAFLEAKLSEF